MNIHYIQHVPFEGIGSIEHWAIENKHGLSSTNMFENNYTFPTLDNFDMLVIMGGPMGVNDQGQFPWLIEEKEFIKTSIDNNKIVLGICLGSQLIAHVLGAKVYKNPQKEIGWFSVTMTQKALTHPLFRIFPKEFITFHWHADTFDLPVNAHLMAESKATKHQAYLYSSKVIGFQFHPEVSTQSISELGLNSHEVLVGENFVQTEDQIKGMISNVQENKKLLFSFLDQLMLLNY